MRFFNEFDKNRQIRNLDQWIYSSILAYLFAVKVAEQTA